MYVEWSGGYIAPDPVFLTGRTSGNYVHIVSDKLSPTGLGLWVRKDQIVTPEEIEG